MRSDQVGVGGMRVLRAIAAGRVHRDTLDGARRGMWALFILDGDEVGMSVRRLRRLGLVAAPMIGDPQ